MSAEIGLRIRELREQAAWSPRDLADACDIRVEYVLDIEDGVPKVHTRTYQKIADALNVNLQYLLTGERETEPAKLDLLAEVPPEWRWLIRLTMRLVIVFGTLNLLLGIICVFGYLALWLAASLPLEGKHEAALRELRHAEFPLQLKVGGHHEAAPLRVPDDPAAVTDGVKHVVGDVAADLHPVSR